MYRFSILFFLCLCTVQSQNLNSTSGGNDSRLNDAFTQLRNRLNGPLLSSDQIQGSPYFNNNFKMARVFYFGKVLQDPIYIRYNAYSDEMEMTQDPRSIGTDQALIKNSKIYCTIDSKTYKYLPLPEGNSQLEKVGYVEEIFKGENYTLFLRNRKLFLEAKKARTSLERSFPARFIENHEWYFQFQNSSLKRFKPKKKEIRKLFKNHSKSIGSYLKDNKSSLKTVGDIKQLFEFLDKREDSMK